MHYARIAIGLFWLLFEFSSTAVAQSPSTASKYALLIGVTTYEHAQMNRTPLKYPEADAKAVGELLRSSGYTIDVLLGKQATGAAIQQILKKAGAQGDSEGAVIIGMFGHGVQYGDDAYYGPFDTKLRPVKDADGRSIRATTGELMLEPDPDRMVSMREILDTLTLSGAGNKVLLADCCREDPNRARGLRGRAFGSSLRVDQLPRNCAALFACSEGERAFEHDEWRHGAFTKAFLDECQGSDDVTANLLSVSLYRRVNGLVKEKTAGADKQSVSSVLSGVIDLKLQAANQPVVPMNRMPSMPSTPSKTRTKGAEPQPSSYVNDVGCKMILIPAGSFTMGARKDDPAILDRDKPQHQVTLSKPYYMGETELTQGQWKAVMGTEPWKEGYWEESIALRIFRGGETKKKWIEPSRFEGADYPVTHVTWDDAVEFCRRLSEREGRTYRLPTEAEWEYACRAGTVSVYSFGDDTTNASLYAWGRHLTEASNEKYAHLVKQKLPNAFSLYDMHGNVSEWCCDGWAYYKPEPVVDPFTAIEFDYRSQRGCSWANYPNRSSDRRGALPSKKSNDLGFRIVSVKG